jgi:predicted DNA binding CopG/RHH family protein
MPARRKHELEVVERLEDIPVFTSEAEEAEFWAAHQLSDALLAAMEPLGEDVLPPPRPRTKPVAVRFDESTLARVRALAARRGKGYQTLLKEFVVERLYEEERREGIVGRARRSRNVERKRRSTGSA